MNKRHELLKARHHLTVARKALGMIAPELPEAVKNFLVTKVTRESDLYALDFAHWAYTYKGALLVTQWSTYELAYRLRRQAGILAESLQDAAVTAAWGPNWVKAA